MPPGVAAPATSPVAARGTLDVSVERSNAKIAPCNMKSGVAAMRWASSKRTAPTWSPAAAASAMDAHFDHAVGDVLKGEIGANPARFMSS